MGKLGKLINLVTFTKQNALEIVVFFFNLLKGTYVDIFVKIKYLKILLIRYNKGQMYKFS